MEREIALSLINANKVLYNQIARDFSGSRYNLWPEFEYFKGYLQDGQEILDLGCGNGRLLEFIKEYKINYLGIDFSEKLVAEAQKKWPEARFISADIFNLPKLDRKFDLVFCIATLHHIPSQELREKAIAIMKGLLNENGKLLMINWNLVQKRYIKYIIKYAILKLLNPDKKINGISAGELDFQDVFIPWQKKHLRYLHAFTERNIEHLLTNAGFEIIKNVANKRNIITVAKIKPKLVKNQ